MSPLIPSTDPVHFMVDLETLDTIPSAVILSIGACVIPVHMDPADGDVFYAEVHVDSQYMRTKSLQTIEWWKQQSNCPDRGTTSLTDALRSFREYLLRITKRPIIWCKGTDFDTAILAHAYRQQGVDAPWRYNDVRDFRTIKKMFSESLVVTAPNLNPHNALADAVHQAKELQLLGLALR